MRDIKKNILNFLIYYHKVCYCTWNLDAGLLSKHDTYVLVLISASKVFKIETYIT